MSDFNDIAKRNPQGAVSVISSFGYEILDRKDLGKSLNELVANEGEPALIKVMEIHPDKDIILELFGNKNNSTKGNFSQATCGCGNASCNGRKSHASSEQYMNASGNESYSATSLAKDNSQSNTLAHQTNAILIVATLFIATALIIKTQK
jgi:hypothetical protein